jgi:hypothetical protein
MPVDEKALLTALHATRRDHGPGLFGLVTEGGEVVFEAAFVRAALRA